MKAKTEERAIVVAVVCVCVLGGGRGEKEERAFLNLRVPMFFLSLPSLASRSSLPERLSFRFCRRRREDDLFLQPA